MDENLLYEPKQDQEKELLSPTKTPNIAMA